MKKIFLQLSNLFITLCLFSNPINIPLGGNAYLIEDILGAKIIEEGVTAWSSPETVISTWFYTHGEGKMKLSIRAKSYDADTEIKIIVDGGTYRIPLWNDEWSIYTIEDSISYTKGYIRVDIQGVSKSTEYFGEISDLIIDGDIVDTELNYVKDFSYYFARRGPSVHLNYPLPEKENIEYFYNEVTVPEGNDVIGSYFMATGFSGGYFGMQVNSETERKILFSVWSPYKTDNPNDIPEEDRVKTLRKGKGVHIGEFGNEGSGGQSYLRYPWQAGETYKFLQQVRPDGKGNTIFTAYFFSPKENEWQLIASFLRPRTDTWYKGAHSFLENFIPNQGSVTRKVLFGNQWAVTDKGKWIELTDAQFTYDATAKAKKRLDCKGGEEGDSLFYLQNCGFFSDGITPYHTEFKRKGGNVKPQVNFNQLKKIKSEFNVIEK